MGAQVAPGQNYERTSVGQAEDRIVKHASHLITTGIFLAALAVNAIEIPRAAAQTKGPCSNLISERNSTFDGARRLNSEISIVRREIADARSPNSGNLGGKVADALSEVKHIRKIIALGGAHFVLDKSYAEGLYFYEQELSKAQARLDFWQAKQTQVLAGDTVTIHVPSSFLKNLELHLAELQRFESREREILARLDREIATCRANNRNKTSTPEPSNVPCAGFTGKWSTSSGEMTLNHGNGSYTWRSGKISGSVSGNVLDGTWTQPNGTGKVHLKLDASGAFTGYWTRDPNPQSAGGWTGTCIKAS